MKLVKTSYSPEDVKILLKDLSDCMEPLSTEERERRIQSGTHYSEMLPLEYRPTSEYMRIYNEALVNTSEKIAEYVGVLSKKLMDRHMGRFVIVSLARAGIPIGILVKRYIKQFYALDIPHYSISIIRGKGIDINAMDYIYGKECIEGDISVEHLQFLDGWTGKGAINNQLKEAVKELQADNAKWNNLSDSLAVLADPANICTLRGTKEDFLIPSSCLNSTVSGLVSRTILNSYIKPIDYHGAVYFAEFESDDKSLEFIDTITSHFKPAVAEHISNDDEARTGLEIVRSIAEEYEIPDINLIKPGIGETTRVLLRRIPWRVLINCDESLPDIEHIIRLCKDRNIPYEKHDLGNYRVCGIIKNLSADA